MLLVAATLTLNDGTTLDGFITPASPEDQDRPDVLGTVQPQMFLPSGKLAGFWEGVFARPAAERAALYTELSRPPERVFPIRFGAHPGIATGAVTGHIDGFYWQPKLRGTPNISRVERASLDHACASVSSRVLQPEHPAFSPKGRT